jgi:hypothetical protein
MLPPPLQVMICPHGRQPSICAICVPILEAEESTRKQREREREDKKRRDEDDFAMISQAAIMGAIL